MRPLRQRISSSEEHPRGKHRPVVIGMELRVCDLHSSADYQGEAIAGIMLQLKFAKHQSWSYEVLHPPVVGSAMVKGRVVFDLWPKESSNVALPRGVSQDWTSQFRSISGGKYSSQRRLHIEAFRSLCPFTKQEKQLLRDLHSCSFQSAACQPTRSSPNNRRSPRSRPPDGISAARKNHLRHSWPTNCVGCTASKSIEFHSVPGHQRGRPFVFP